MREDTDARILVVDDELALAETLRDLLLFHGYQVEIATNGIQAQEALKKHTFDLVISDIRMPMMDGNAAALSYQLSLPRHTRYSDFWVL